ncbi:MAG: bifunctional pyr operon transcriptional regulator/uracil phosphoribosyltransferase PyrR [Actinomycetaceae bacterium]|nr:bifunctional pyr operon transcriptional regulator/uracil phosphoribosyltransferase PyrR [Actinomycetaceae bacterium]
MTSTKEKVVLTAADIERALTRIAYEVIECTKGGADLVILGIPTRGATLAKRLAQQLRKITNTDVAVGSLDITMYRDDLADQPLRTPHPTSVPAGGIDNRTVVLVDDVLYTGRTVNSALDALFDIGRPKRVLLAVLVDRGHRELPIRPDFVGKNLPTSKSESVEIHCQEIDGTDAVIITEAK